MDGSNSLLVGCLFNRTKFLFLYEMSESDKFIDIEKLFKDKNPALLKWIPAFVIRYLKKTIHQEEVNEFMLRHKHDNSFTFALNVVKEFNIKVKVKGLENVPKHGGCIFASNHPLGGLDALIAISVLDNVRHDLKFIVNDLLMYITNLQELFEGVNKHGRNNVNSLQQVDQLFKSEKAIFIFPAGLVSRKINNEIKDLEWKKTFITRSRKYNKKVIPVYIDGKNSDFFYNLANIRKKLGLKANIEMLYLSDEMFRQNGNSIGIAFGKPIEPSFFDSTKKDDEWAEFVKQQCYNLKGEIFK